MPKCDNCDKTITKKSPGLECNKCGKVVHANQICSGLSSKQLSAVRNAENLEWTCDECHKESPRRKSFVIPEDDENEEDNGSELDGSSAAVNKLLRDVSLEVKKAVKKELASVNESLSTCCLRMNAVNSTLAILTEKVKEMEKKNTYLTNQNTHLELKIDALEQHIRNIEQETLANVLEVTGIPDNENENLGILSTKIASKLNIEKHQVTSIKRLKGRNGKEGVIQVVLQQEQQVDQWIRAARKEPIVVQDVVPEVSPDLAKSKVLFRYALTKANKSLLWQAKQTLKETYKYIWFQNGRILVRKIENDKPTVIRNTSDIDKIAAQVNNCR